MTPLAFGIVGIEAWPIDLRTPLVWLGLAFGLLAVATLIWIALGSVRRRWTGHHVNCPVDGSRAHVFIERDDDGAVVDVATCSRMSPPGHVTCGRHCRAAIPARA